MRVCGLIWFIRVASSHRNRAFIVQFPALICSNDDAPQFFQKNELRNKANANVQLMCAVDDVKRKKNNPDLSVSNFHLFDTAILRYAIMRLSTTLRKCEDFKTRVSGHRTKSVIKLIRYNASLLEECITK